MEDPQARQNHLDIFPERLFQDFISKRIERLAEFGREFGVFCLQSLTTSTDKLRGERETGVYREARTCQHDRRSLEWNIEWLPSHFGCHLALTHLLNSHTDDNALTCFDERCQYYSLQRASRLYAALAYLSIVV